MTAAASLPTGSDGDAISVGERVALKAELSRQGDELAALRALVMRMAGELGIDVDDAAQPDT
jgi:hypothetical protein